MSNISHGWDHPVSPKQVDKAVKLSYAQAMVSAVYVTAGSFMVAYALKLGADDVQIGLLSTIPMFAVVMQLVSAIMIERGASRKRMTVVGAMLSVCSWLLIIAVPYALRGSSGSTKITVLIGLVTLISVFGNLSGNARASWIGDLIPSHRLGSFFGKLTLYGGIISCILTVAQGRFLDHVKGAGVYAFGWVFAFGTLFGLVNAFLFIPQASVRTEKHDIGIVELIRSTFARRELMLFMAFAILWNMQSIGWPFYAPYLLRDIKFSYTMFGVIHVIQVTVINISAPFWGNVVEKYGCRPVLIFCALITLPVATAWLWINTASAAYAAVPVINVITGFANGGIAVAMSTMLYKVTSQKGRALQMAIYSVALAALVAPMPVIGGHLPGWLRSLGLHADLRSTFIASQFFALFALFAARKIIEPGSERTSTLISNLPDHLVKPKTLR